MAAGLRAERLIQQVGSPPGECMLGYGCQGQEQLTAAHMQQGCVARGCARQLMCAPVNRSQRLMFCARQGPVPHTPRLIQVLNHADKLAHML